MHQDSAFRTTDSYSGIASCEHKHSNTETFRQRNSRN